MSIIEWLLDNPAVIIGGSIVLFVVILLNQLLDANGDIGYIALVVGISTVLYTRKSMILQVRMEHTKDLHTFLQEWLNLLENRQTKLVPLLTTLRVPFWQKDSYTPEYGLYLITNNGLYNDLLNNHVPDEHSKFYTDWNKYKISTETYERSCRSLYLELLKQIERSFTKSMGIKINENFEVDKFVVNLNYIKFVYVSYMSQIIDYDYLKNPNFTIRPYTVNGGQLYSLLGYSEGQEYTVANGTEQQMKKVQRKLADDIKNARIKYQDSLKGYTLPVEKTIIAGHRGQDIVYAPCVKILKELLNYPVLSGTNCYILRKI
jgi:hypothetical protein